MSAARHRASLVSASLAVLVALAAVGAADGGKRGGRDRQAPSPPSNIQVRHTTQTEVLLTWHRSRDNVRVSGYDVWVNGERDRVRTPIYIADGLTCGESVAIWVAAVDRRGNRSRRVGATASTSACLDGRAPTPPSDFRQDATTQDTVVLSWSASSDEVGVVGYGLYQAGLLVESTSQPTVTLAGLRCDMTYEYAVDAVDASGNRSVRATAWVQTAACPDVEEPSMPADLSVTTRSATSLSVAWRPASDNVGVAGYLVWVGGAQATTVTETRTTLSDLVCGTTYTLGVSAVDAAGNPSPRAITSATTTACPTTPNSPPPGPQSPATDDTPPAAPTAITVSAAAPTSITLSWGAAADDVGVTSYAVFRNGTSVQTTSQRVATVSALTCGTAYTLGVEARDAAGNRSQQAVVVASTSACADTQKPTAPAGPVATSRTQNSISLAWSGSTDNVGVVGYGLYRNGALVGTSTATTGVFSGLTCNVNYTLAVDAYDAVGNRSAKSAALLVSTTACPDSTPPSGPAGLAASAVSQTGLTLSWSASTDNVGVTGYDVYRGGSKVASVATTSNVQTGLACGTSYSFGVVARDAAGNSSPQALLAAATSACPTPPAPSPPPQPTPPPTGSSAQLWVDANGGSCARSATPAAYSDSTACTDLDAAHGAAQQGDTVRVRSGNYGDVTLSADKGAARVTFVAAAGESPAWTQVTLARGAAHVGFENLRIDRFYSAKCLATEASCGGSSARNRDVSFVNVQLRTFELTFVDGVTMTGGDVSPGGRCSNPHPLVATDVNPAATWAPKNITFNGVRFHDAIHEPQCGNTECLYIWGGEGITVKNSSFRNCYSTGSMYVTMLNTANVNSYCTGIVVENNFFYGHDDGSPEYVHFESDCEILVRHNTFSRGSRPFVLNSGHGGEIVRHRQVTLVGNYGNHPPIKDGGPCATAGDDFTFVANVWRGGTCDPTDLAATAFQVVNEASDLHLVAGASAIDRGSSGNYPATDRDGQTRYSGAAPDAGADER